MSSTNLFSLNTLQDSTKNKIYGFTGENNFRDNLVRSAINFQDFYLTAAQMDALNATPITVLAAPGAGLANLVTAIFTYINPGATPFELGSGTLQFLYTDGSGSSVATTVPNAQVESATATYYWSPASAVVPVVNAVIVAKASADVTAGDGKIYGRIFYQTIGVAELL